MRITVESCDATISVVAFKVAFGEPETHRVDAESGSTLRLLYGFSVKLLGQPANFGSTL
jgi:hypothetical protein